MRPARSLFATVVLVSAASPAFAQQPGEPSATVEQAVARAVADAMPDLRYPWALNWSAFGVRGGRDIFWHLAPPGPGTTDAPPGTRRRTGWLSVSGRSGDVAVCGNDEQISGMAISVSDIWLGRSDVIRELADRGVAATLIESREATLAFDDGSAGEHYLAHITRYPAQRRWRLEREGREPADLTAVFSCTSPGTRSATSCRMTWNVQFRPDESSPEQAHCLPGRQ